MHLLIASEAWPGHREKLMKDWETHGYRDKTAEGDARFPVQWREVRLWDVAIHEECLDDFMREIAPYIPPRDYLRKHSPRLASLGRLARRLLRPFGLRSIQSPVLANSMSMRKTSKGESVFCWFEPLGTIPELRDPETGKELL